MEVITGGQLISLLYIVLTLRFVMGNQSTLCEPVCTDDLLVSPGDGEQFVYSPIGVDAALHCAVNNTILTWIVDGLSLDNPVQR